MSEEDELKEKYSTEEQDESDNNQIDIQGTNIESTRLGHVMAMQGYEPVVSSGPDSIHFYVDSDKRDKAGVGSYVATEVENDAGNVLMFGRVSKLKYEIKRGNQDDRKERGYNKEIREDSLAYIGEVSPISKVVMEDNSLIGKNVDRPPRPDEDTSLIEDHELLKTGLDIPELGTFTGYLAVNGSLVPDEDNPLHYNLFNPNYTDGNADEGEPQIFRHTLVAGKTGTGKTHFSKNLLRQFAECKRFGEEQKRLNLTILDPENEYIEMGEDNDSMPDEFKKRINSQGINHGGLNNVSDADFRVWVPTTSEFSPSLSGTQFRIPFRLVEDRPELLIPTEAGGQTRMVISDSVEEFFEECRNRDSLESTFGQFKDWLDAYFEDDSKDVHPAVERAVRSRILRSDEYRRVFGSRHGDPIDEIADMIFDEGTVSVIPIKHLSSDEQLVVLSILSFIVDNKISADVDYPNIKNTPMLLCLDEAHKFLSEPDTARQQYVVNKFEKAARRGRKDKFGLYAVTQNPEDIQDTVRGQINTRIFLELDDDVVSGSGVSIPNDYESRVTSLNKGEAVVDTPNADSVEIVGLEECLTEHS